MFLFQVSNLLSHRLVKTGLLYSVTSTIYSVCTLIAGFVILRWVDPVLLGLWQSIAIANYYLPILQLGIHSGLNLELPIVLGENNIEQAQKLVKTGLYYAVFLSFIMLVIGLFAFIYVYCNSYDSKIVYGVISVCIIAISSNVKMHYVATYRSAGAFSKLSLINLLSSIAALIMICFIYFYQYEGMLLYYVFTDAIYTLSLYVYAPYRKISPKFYKDTFVVLLKRGVYMTTVNQILQCIQSVPRILLLRFGSITQVGLFHPALVVGTFINMLPAQLVQFLQPQMGFKYGQTQRAKDMWRYLLYLTVLTPIFSLPFVVIGWICLPYVFEVFFPKYIEAITPIRVMLIGFVFSSTYMSQNFLSTIKAYTEVIIFQIFSLVCFVAFPYFMIKMYPEDLLTSMAIGMSFAYFVTYIVNAFLVRYTVFKNKYN